MSFPIDMNEEELRKSVKHLERLEQIIANIRKLTVESDNPVVRKIIVTKDQYRMFESAGMCMDDLVIGYEICEGE